MQRRVSVRVVIYTQMDVCVRNTSPEHFCCFIQTNEMFCLLLYCDDVFNCVTSSSCLRSHCPQRPGDEDGSGVRYGSKQSGPRSDW